MDTVTLTPDDALRAARQAVQGGCAQAVTGPECAEHAVLLTSEVVANAVVHGAARSASAAPSTRSPCGSR